jgi:hypothetical protein
MWKLGDNGGSPVTGQTVWAFQNGTCVGSVAVSATATSVKIGGLTVGAPYTFTVTATNGVGTSPESAASSPVTPTR